MTEFIAGFCTGILLAYVIHKLRRPPYDPVAEAETLIWQHQ